MLPLHCVINIEVFNVDFDVAYASTPLVSVASFLIYFVKLSSFMISFYICSCNIVVNLPLSFTSQFVFSFRFVRSIKKSQ